MNIFISFYWKDLSVIYVAGSEIEVAPTAPTASPGSTSIYGYLYQRVLKKKLIYLCVTWIVLST